MRSVIDASLSINAHLPSSRRGPEKPDVTYAYSDGYRLIIE